MPEIGLYRNMEDIVRQYDGLICADIVARQKTEVSPKYYALLRQLEEAMEKNHFQYIHRADPFVHFPLEVPVLSPAEINEFLQGAVCLETHRNYELNMGPFISRLIEKSFEAGNDAFCLDTVNILKLAGLGYNLKGTEDKRISLTIKGDAGKEFCDSSSYVSAMADSIGGRSFGLSKHASVKAGQIGENFGTCAEYLEAEAESIGSHSGSSLKFSSCTAKKIRKAFGSSSMDCTVNADEIGGDFGLSAERFRLTVEKVIGEVYSLVAWGIFGGPSTRKSVFRSPDKSTVRSIKGIMGWGRGNRYYHITPDGEERIYWPI